MTGQTIAHDTNAFNGQIVRRKTRGGRTLRYELAVIQQPERARACGSGTKSAADRRPVDPPPVVELRVFEEDVDKHITFKYNANFFVFASLVHARPMAHGRVQTPSATASPVLAGAPASGMAYLDRPAEAGYFLFPDLSVRHEGRYKLVFNLYEETKDEADLDHDAPYNPETFRENFTWRMEVTTLPFSVFSAKKFPGLSESTALSRTVAEQGCRVRIRRDVRMRKRDSKGGSNFDGDPDYAHRHRQESMSPERQLPPDQYRARSQSAASDHGKLPYGPDHQRRTSGAESYPPGPPGYNQPLTPASHLGFGHASHIPYHAQYPQQPPISPTTSHPSNGHSSPFQTPAASYINPSSRPSSQSNGTLNGGRNLVHIAPAPSPSVSTVVSLAPAPAPIPVDERRRSLNNTYPSMPPYYTDNPVKNDEGMPRDYRPLPSITASQQLSPPSGQGYPQTQYIPPIKSPKLEFQADSRLPSVSRLPSFSALLHSKTEPNYQPYSRPELARRSDLQHGFIPSAIIEPDENPHDPAPAGPSTGDKRQRDDDSHDQNQRPLRNGERPQHNLRAVNDGRPMLIKTAEGYKIPYVQSTFYD